MIEWMNEWTDKWRAAPIDSSLTRKTSVQAHFGRALLSSSQLQWQTPWLILFTGITSKQNNWLAFHWLDFYLPSFWNVFLKRGWGWWGRTRFSQQWMAQALKSVVSEAKTQFSHELFLWLCKWLNFNFCFYPWRRNSCGILLCPTVFKKKTLQDRTKILNSCFQTLDNKQHRTMISKGKEKMR